MHGYVAALGYGAARVVDGCLVVDQRAIDEGRRRILAHVSRIIEGQDSARCHGGIDERREKS